MAWPPSWYAIRRRSSSLITRLLRSGPAITRSMASSTSFIVMLFFQRLVAQEGRLVDHVGEVGAREPGCAAGEDVDLEEQPRINW